MTEQNKTLLPKFQFFLKNAALVKSKISWILIAMVNTLSFQSTLSDKWERTFVHQADRLKRASLADTGLYGHECD